ncbi:MAG: hypothetical protein FJ100_09275 [Deltaproteobacteria bacterium]|nr:hypothetical protein [Deltaproteobacteria bacterium]
MTDRRSAVAELAQAIGTDADQPVAHAGCYFFVSYDLAGATEFKAREPARWPAIFAAFYEVAASEVETRLPQSCLWKFAGDEVLFYLRLEGGVPSLQVAVEAAYQAMIGALKGLAEKYPKDWHGGASDAGPRQRHGQAQLSIKATAWTAAVGDGAAVGGAGPAIELDPMPNRMVIGLANGRGGGVDFLGPEIDAGFRIGKLAWPGILTVSAECAYLAFEFGTPPFAKRMNIVGYESLKGVWRQRP